MDRLVLGGDAYIALSGDGAEYRPASTIMYSRIARGRHVEDLPRIAAVLCGTQSWSHYIALSIALDRVFGRTPPPAATRLRAIGLLLDRVHGALYHVYTRVLPIITGTGDPISLALHDPGLAESYSNAAEKLAEAKSLIGGRPAHPAFTVPGGLAKPFTPEQAEALRRSVAEAADAVRGFVENAYRVLQGSERIRRYASMKEMLLGEVLRIALVDEEGRASPTGSRLRIIDADGKEISAVPVEEYREAIVAECGGNGVCVARHRDGGHMVSGVLGRAAAGGHAAVYNELVERAEGIFGGEPWINAASQPFLMLAEALEDVERARALAEGLEPGRHVSLEGRIGEKGVGAAEAVHGIVIHEVSIDHGGVVVSAEAVTGTMINIPVINEGLGRLRGAGADRWDLVLYVYFYAPCGLEAMHTRGG